MAHFSTSFSLEDSVSPQMFLDVACEWLNGMRDFRFKTDINRLKADERVDLSDTIGTLAFRNFVFEGRHYIGGRYTVNDGRLTWNTELVYMKSDQSASFSVRVQNLSGMADPNLPNPRRPFIVKRMLKEGWGGYDGSIKIRDRAQKLHSADIDLVSNIFNGFEQHRLPLIYVSLDAEGRYRLNCDKLAWELGGVAHVFCESSREFSYQLAKRVGFKNPYLGGIGVLLPDGRLERYRPEVVDEDAIERIRLDVIRATSNAVSSEVCSWSIIRDIEASLALERLKQQKSSDVDAYVEAFDDQINSLREQISNLENENTTLKLRAAIARSLNCPLFRPDTRHKQEGSSTGLRTSLCLTNIDALK